MTTTPIARRGLLTAMAAAPLAAVAVAATAPAAEGLSLIPGIPLGYESVDPRTAKRIPLWQELSTNNPLFPDDPPFTYEIADTIATNGYLLEKITSLGTHTGTHISAPAHFVEGAKTLAELDESWTLMPLAVIDVRSKVSTSGGNFSIGVNDLKTWELTHGILPEKGCVLLNTGLSGHYTPATGPGVADDYFDAAPGFTGAAVAWLFDSRRIKAVGSDTFGPDASSDSNFEATSTALQKGGITVENVGPNLSKMRQFGDWVSINGARPRFSGFQMGITGFTLPF